jgi:hypothetical protein
MESVGTGDVLHGNSPVIGMEVHLNLLNLAGP